MYMSLHVHVANLLVRGIDDPSLNFILVLRLATVILYYITTCSLSTGNRWNHIDNLDEFFERVSQVYMYAALIVATHSCTPVSNR